MPSITPTRRLLALLAAGAILWFPCMEAEGQDGQRKRASGKSDIASRPELAVPLGDQASRQKIGKVLNQITVDLIHLRRISKQVHWNVTGQHFYAVHEASGEFAQLLSQHIDMIAERSLALGVPVDGRVATVQSKSRLEAGPTGFTPDTKMVRLLKERLAKMSGLLRGSISDLGEHDTVAQDMLISAKADIDKYHWQFAVQTKD